MDQVDNLDEMDRVDQVDPVDELDDVDQVDQLESITPGRSPKLKSWQTLRCAIPPFVLREAQCENRDPR